MKEVDYQNFIRLGGLLVFVGIVASFGPLLLDNQVKPLGLGLAAIGFGLIHYGLRGQENRADKK